MSTSYLLYVMRTGQIMNTDTNPERHVIRVESACDTEPMIFDVPMIILVFVNFLPKTFVETYLI